MHSQSKEFGMELIRLNKTIEAQDIAIVELELKAAMYKANFFHKYELAEKLHEQIKQNYDHCTGEFDGFCYASWRAKAVYRTIEDMCREGLITKEEYNFCLV